MELLFPYLPSLAWYRAYTAHRLGLTPEPPRLPRHFCRAEVEAPFGRRTLSVPVEGGRRLITPRRYPLLTLSDHGNWRHTHLSTITSAYGSFPFFRYYKDDLEAVYTAPLLTLPALCTAFHDFTNRAMALDSTLQWLAAHPSAPIAGRADSDADSTLCFLHILFLHGPSAIFSLLPSSLHPQQ